MLRNLLFCFWALLASPAFAQWTVQNTGTNAPLFALSQNGTHWLAGSLGTVLYSDNNGASWVERELRDPVSNLPIAADVRCVRLLSPQSGLASGTFLLGNTQMVAVSNNAFASLGIIPINSGGGYPRLLYDWSFPQPGVGFACGANYSLVKTNDGGQSWSLANNSGAELFGIDFFDENHGIAVGAYTLLLTSNGGANWQTLPAPTVFLDVSMASASVVFAISENQLYRSTDGGQNWLPAGVPPLFGLKCVEALDEHSVLLGTTFGIFKVDDDGQAWSVYPETQIELPNFNYVGINQLYRSGNSWWAACDHGYLMKGSDTGPAQPLAIASTSSSGGGCDTFYYQATAFAGNTWSLQWWLGDQLLSTAAQLNLTFTQTVVDTLRLIVDNGSATDTAFWPIAQEVFVDVPEILPPQVETCSGTPLQFYPAGDAQVFLWEPPVLFMDPNVNNAIFTGSGDATVVAYYYYQGCIGSDTVQVDILDNYPPQYWHPTVQGTSHLKFILDFVDGQHGFAVEKNGDKFIRTNDGALNWSDPHTFFNPNASTASIDFVDTSTGYVSIGQGLFRTIDGGQSWSLVSFQTGLNNLNFFDETTGIASGPDLAPLSFNLYKTTDSGQNWTPEYSGIGQLAGIKCRTPDDCYCLGYNGAQSVVLRSSDQGSSWQTTAFNGLIPFVSFDFLGPDSLIAMGFSGDLYFSYDAGASWTEPNWMILPAGSVNGTEAVVAMANSQTGFLSLNFDLFKTFDGGQCWYKLSAAETGGYTASDFAFPDSTHWYFASPLAFDLLAPGQIFRLDSVPFTPPSGTISAVKHTSAFQPSPNPVASGQMLRIPLAGEWQIFDLSGRIVSAGGQVKADESIPIILPPGLYLLSLRQRERLLTCKLVVAP